MTQTVEMQLSNYRIDKAAARLAFQQAAVRRMPPDTAPHLAQIAEHTLAKMKCRMAKLLVDHESLVREQGQAADVEKSHHSVIERKQLLWLHRRTD